ncbi:hypothetical protein KI387_024706, partial [Taxus chinensis]
ICRSHDRYHKAIPRREGEDKGLSCSCSRAKEEARCPDPEGRISGWVDEGVDNLL